MCVKKPAVQTNTASAAAATTTTVNDTTTAATATATATITAGETSSSSATGTVSRQWASANRRRPAQSRRPVRSSSNQDAAEKISAVANIQADYYKEKLKMKQQQHELFLVEHAKRMHVLDLQEQLTVKQLRKFDE